jgi:hypothetical protein
MSTLPFARALRGLASLVLLGCLTLLCGPRIARAQDANDYGARGRTIVTGSLGGYDSTVRTPDPFAHEYSWSLGGQLTLVHFWFRNIALGGTILGGASQLKDDFVPTGGPAAAWAGGDLDAVFHIPISRRFSMRFWLWGGARWSRVNHVLFDTSGYYLGLDSYGASALSLKAGLAVDPLVHLSPSVALALGPSIDISQPLDGGDFDYHIRVTPSMSYSFGPDSEQGGSSLEPARLFSARGRTAMSMYFWADASDLTTGFDLVRFVAQGIGLGAYASMGFVSSSGVDYDYLSFGVQAMVDLPLEGSLSILLVPQVGYALRRDYMSDDDWTDRPMIGAHELRLALPAYLALHLRQGLVLGVGPRLASDLRVHHTGPELPNEHYVQAGVASTLSASF